MAVIDTGVDRNHPDLRGSVVIVRGSNQAGWTCTAGPCRDNPSDEGGHGTFVAGIIAARRNGIGVVGVAPRARILPIKYDSRTDVQAAIRFAVDHGAKVVNLSLAEGFLPPDPEREAGSEYAWRHGALVVAIADNNSYPFCAYPAASVHALCVGATNHLDVKSTYSSFGENLDVVAPGGELVPCDTGEAGVISTMLPGLRLGLALGVAFVPFPCDDGLPDGYASWAGTSFAAPMVSGVAALLFSRGLNNRQVYDRITRCADDLGPAGYDPIYGWGRMNALRAVRGC